MVRRQTSRLYAQRLASIEPQLFDQTHVVAACPMFHDHAVCDPPDVDEPPRRGPRPYRYAVEERHRRTSVRPVDRDVLNDKIALGDEVVLLEGDRTEVVLDRLQDLAEAFPALRAGSVVHHVFGNQVIEHRHVVRFLSPDELLDDVPCAAFIHRVIRSDPVPAA